ncbi:MAG: phosphogluconate dehydrogenase (NAD(+)-dependent, decarboxylating) [Acidobacteriota bacterium]
MGLSRHFKSNRRHNMELGIIGLGRMGANMTQRLLNGGHHVSGFDQSPGAVKAIEQKGATGAGSLPELVGSLAKPRAIWMMVPAGEAVTETIRQLLPHLSADDVLIDGGNSYYKDSKRRAQELHRQQIHYLDVGTSGGIWGLEVGYCLMIGGEKQIFQRLEPIFKTLAPDQGYAYIGPSGAGHFTKMIHNGIEYGMMQAYGEGFELLKASEFEIDLQKVAGLWNHGSVVRSWLLELAERAFAKDPELASIRGYVEDSGEGRWTVMESIEKSVPAPVLTLSLQTRFRSRQDDSFSAKVLAALRNEFGGHAVKSK